MRDNIPTHFHPTRRRLLQGVAGFGALSGLPVALREARAADVTALNVLSPAPPDPAPPGAAKFSEDAFVAWKKANNATVTYDALSWPQLHDKMATSFASGEAVWDIVYMCGWVPEFSQYVQPLLPGLSKELVEDLPKSSFATTTWGGETSGVVFTLSLLTLFYNTEMLDKAGFKAAPRNWEELKSVAKELTRDGNYGWVTPYGDPAGIGGTASQWMCFLQQAGGKLYNEDGTPAINSEAGIAGLQMMIDLMPYSDPGSLSYVGTVDATNVMTAGKAALMMNWPFMWKPANDPATSKIVGKLGVAVLPAGPAGTASIDGTDAWTIPKTSKNPELSQKLIEFYLSKEAQKRQALDTGWLPIRLSVLSDPEVQKAMPNAATLLEQAKHPYETYVTPDYNEVTVAIGTEINKALAGKSSAKEALAEAQNLVAAIVKRRG